MKINKIILSGIILILFAGILFITDIFTPFIRPITYLFLMGSSKGKDILFFALIGLFLILSQIKMHKHKSNKFLLITVLSGTLIFAIAIILEIYLRIRLGIWINTIFVNMKPTFSTTSILHSHLIKSILGEAISSTINPFVSDNINTATGLYTYISSFTIPIVILIILLFISGILSLQNRSKSLTILLSFFETILIIGCFDGGIMGTPGALGLFGCIWIYKNHKYIDNYFEDISKNKNIVKTTKRYLKKQDKTTIKIILNRWSPYLIGLFIIILRLSISFMGASSEYYDVDIYNPDNNVDLSHDYPVESINVENNKINYKMSNSLNEHELTMNLSNSLNNSCDYYTVTWNAFSFL